MAERKGRYAKLFERLRENGDGAFVPFLTLGDPTPSASPDMLRALVEGGADALELGIPFSDPVADGPVIQSSANRALDAGATPSGCFETVKKIRGLYPELPIGLLVYANLVVTGGIDAFYGSAAESGVDSVLIADAPVSSHPIFAPYAMRHNIDTVYVVPPNADCGKTEEIARSCGGYTYLLGRSGVTGAEREMSAPDTQTIKRLKNAGAPPIMVGFGISRPEHVRGALLAGADGAISGSATVAIIAANLGNPEKTRAALSSFVREMRDATKGMREK
jgi:tryptophan synthase alpha chain